MHRDKQKFGFLWELQNAPFCKTASLWEPLHRCLVETATSLSYEREAPHRNFVKTLTSLA